MTGISLVIVLISFSLLYAMQLVYNRFVLKLLVVTYLFLISSGIYFSFDSYKGWPSKDKLESGYLVYSLVVEPSDEDKGAIYYWAVPDTTEQTFLEKFLSYDFGQVAPRAFYLPYSKQAAADFAEANEQIKKGMIVKIESSETKKQMDGEGNQETRGEGTDPTAGDQEKYDVPHLNIISPDKLLRKAPQ